MSLNLTRPLNPATAIAVALFATAVQASPPRHVLAQPPTPTTEPTAGPASDPSPASATTIEDAEAAGEAPPEITTTAALGEGLRVRAGDGFSLQLRARMQLQAGFAMPTRDAVDAGSNEDVTTSFLARRVRLVLTGHAFTPTLRYYFQFGFGARDVESDRPIAVRDAYMTWQPTRDIGLRWGQMKVPHGVQRVVSSSALQMVDRSIVTGEFNLDRDVGIVAMSEDFLGLDGRLMYQVGIFGGRGRNRFDGIDEALFAGRIQVNPFGSFDHLAEADLDRRTSPRLSLGLSAAYHPNGTRTRSTHANTFTFGRFDTVHLGADVHFKFRGFSFVGEFFRRSARDRSVTRIDPTDPTITQVEYARVGLGWFSQAGYLFPSNVELVMRYGEIRSDVVEDLTLTPTAVGGAMGNERELGGGLGYYISGHALKVQCDYFRLWSPDDDAAARHQVRVQTQLYF